MATFRARYVFPVDRPPIEDGVLVFHHDHIVSVERYSGQADCTDLGNGRSFQDWSTPTRIWNSAT